MIAIVNVSSDDTPLVGLNDYEVRINNKVICKFQHNRQHNGLAQCLLSAAAAVQQHDNRSKADFCIEDMLKVIKNHKKTN